MKVHRPPILRILATAALLLVPFQRVPAQNPGGELEQGFLNPPDSAKPQAWWHWLNGNVTKEGITADLEWMHRAGIAGMQMIDANLGTPQFLDQRLVWMTPEWKDAFRHAANEAHRLGLEMGMEAAGGWSETGGPWVKPQAAMKKIVWSETLVEGPRKFSGVLRHPPTNNGRFQDMGMPMELSNPTPQGSPVKSRNTHHRRPLRWTPRFTRTARWWLTACLRAKCAWRMPTPGLPRAKRALTLRPSPMAIGPRKSPCT